VADFDLFSLDHLPAYSSVECELEPGHLRFRALSASAPGEVERVSAWSGWFAVHDAPIRLSWDAFEWDEPQRG
jgi:hypothetical protein